MMFGRPWEPSICLNLVRKERRWKCTHFISTLVSKERCLNLFQAMNNLKLRRFLEVRRKFLKFDVECPKMIVFLPTIKFQCCMFSIFASIFTKYFIYAWVVAMRHLFISFCDSLGLIRRLLKLLSGSESRIAICFSYSII